MLLFRPTTVICLSILSKVILLSAPPMLTLEQVPLTVSVLLEPPTLSPLPSAQSSSAVVPNDPWWRVLPIWVWAVELSGGEVVGWALLAAVELPAVVLAGLPVLFVLLQPATPNVAVVSAAAKAIAAAATLRESVMGRRIVPRFVGERIGGRNPLAEA